MTTALQTQLPKDPATGLTLPLRKSLGSQELTQHRAMVALELEILAKKFDRFGWDRDRNTPAQDRLIVDWMDALQDYPLDEVKAACRAAVLADPKTLPNEGHIVAKIMQARGEFVAARKRAGLLNKPEPERVITPEDLAKRRQFSEQLLGRFKTGNRA